MALCALMQSDDQHLHIDIVTFIMDQQKHRYITHIYQCYQYYTQLINLHECRRRMACTLLMSSALCQVQRHCPKPTTVISLESAQIHSIHLLRNTTPRQKHSYSNYCQMLYNMYNNRNLGHIYPNITWMLNHTFPNITQMPQYPTLCLTSHRCTIIPHFP